MLSVALKYRKAVDCITADKGLKLRKFELDDDEWKIVDDLIDVLEVMFTYQTFPNTIAN
jgi:hypothetical protein